MLYRKCEICGLKSERKDGIKRYFMARLPLDELRCKEWVKVIGKEDLAYLPIEKLNQSKFICGKHFKDNDFNKKRTQLKKTAIPSLRLTAKPLSEEILSEFPYHLFERQQPTQDKPSTSSTPHLGSLFTLDELLPTVTPQVEITKDEKADQILYEDDIPAVEYTINIMTSDHCLTENDDPSTSSSSVSLSLMPKEHTLDRSRKDDPSTSSSSVSLSLMPKEHTLDRSRKVVRKRCGPRTKKITNDNLTPRKKKLMKKVEVLKSKIRKFKEKSKLFDNIQSKSLRTIMFSAIKNQNRSSQGKRWSENDKALAIAMYKKSPKLYRYLRYLLPLPSPRTLQIALSRMPINTGFNKSIIDHLKRKVKELSTKDRTCVLLFDEMSLKKRLIYNSANDKVEGYQDLGEHGRSGELADKALVFLLQGVRKKFKQPLAHYFVKGTISSEKLVAIINNVIKIVSEIGFKVIATVCDQGPTNVGALNLLKKFSGQPLDGHFFTVDNHKVYIIFDIPHLFKSIRNNFFEGGILVFDGTKARWSHLVEFEEHNRKTFNFKKVTPLHVNPKFRAKMKVKLAAQILSNDVSAMLSLFSETFNENLKEVDGSLKRDAVLSSAKVINELDRLFDLSNGPASEKDVKKGKRVNVSKNSIHHELWPEFKEKIKSMHFLKSNSQLRLRNVRCVNGYYTSICSFQDIWNYVKSIGFKFLNLRQLNQDSLENLFGLIRQHSPTNQNPTCHHFTAALKTSILMKLSNPIRGANCDPDDNELILDFHDLVFKNTDDFSNIDHDYPVSDDKDKEEFDIENPILHLPDFDTDFEETLFEHFDKQPVVYVSGYLASVLVKGTTCFKCCDCLRTLEPGNDKTYRFIALKEWWPEKRSLTYPTLSLCNTVNLCLSVFERDVRPLLYINDIVKYCSVILQKEVDITWMCEEHSSVLMDALLTKLSLLLVRNDCKKLNMAVIEKEESNANINKIAQLTSSAK